MPDRTKEQMQQIYDDLVAVREVVNQLHDMGELWPTPMNGKTWEEEKNEHYLAGINAMTDLLQSGKIKSCEVISSCELGVSYFEEKKNRSGFWNHCGSQYYCASDRVINNGRTSIDMVLEELELALQERLSEDRLSQLNLDIDSFGDSACGPRAMLENTVKSDGLDSNLSLPKVNNVNCQFRA